MLHAFYHANTRIVYRCMQLLGARVHISQVDEGLEQQPKGALATLFALPHLTGVTHNVRYTPTIFLDGYDLPPGYDTEELAYFLQE